MQSHRVALNVELAAGEAPEWVELIPAGPRVVGRDGRAWLHDRPQSIVDAFTARNTPLPLDWEHATEHKAPRGEAAPAAGWIEELEARDGGAIWGRVAWTPRGASMVANREYRFLSPVFGYEPATTRIRYLASAGLTNTPNLHLTALNREEIPPMKRVLTRLGLAETATEEDALAAVERLTADLATAANRAATPELAKFVPRADYDALLARATNAEQTLAEQAAAAREAEIETAVNAAVEAGKVSPATADHYRAICRTEDGMEQFTALVEKLPVIGEATALNARAPEGATASSAALELGRVFGNSAEDLKHYGG